MTSNRRLLIKVGGSIIGEGDTSLEDLVWLQGNGYEPVVVHGGGKIITSWLEKARIPTSFAGGIRVTDAQSIDMAVAMLAGLVNKTFVAKLLAAGGKAVGISGVDGGVLHARIKRPELGFVGEVATVNLGLLENLIDQGYIPVIAPIAAAASDTGQAEVLVNINADFVAASVASSMKVAECIFLTDVPGVINTDGKVYDRLTAEEAKSLISKVVTGGMIPKVEACLQALGGAGSSLILDGRKPNALKEAISGRYAGTRIE